MAEFPALPLWTDAYLGDTTHLTTIEHGAYLLLLISMWRTPDKKLPDDDGKLARYARLTKGQWVRIKATLMPFFTVTDGYLTQGRLSDEAEAVRQNSKMQSNRVKRRWLKNKKTNDTVVIPDAYRSDTSLTLTHTVSKDTGADAPVDPLWGPSLTYLMDKTGKSRASCASVMGKWIKDSSREIVLSAITAAQVERAVDPVSYVSRIVGNKSPGKPDSGGYRPMGPGGG